MGTAFMTWLESKLKAQATCFAWAANVKSGAPVENCTAMMRKKALTAWDSCETASAHQALKERTQSSGVGNTNPGMVTGTTRSMLDEFRLEAFVPVQVTLDATDADAVAPFVGDNRALDTTDAMVPFFEMVLLASSASAASAVSAAAASDASAKLATAFTAFADHFIAIP